MIVLLGESASGKTTLQNMFLRTHPEYKKIVTYTTRPMRDKEVNGTDYIFVSESAFNEFVKNDFFVEHTTYNGWSYGIAKLDCEQQNAIVILTPAGLRTLKKLNYDTTSIYLYVDRRQRLINILRRGDNIDEAYRRNLSDLGQFDGMANEADYVIDNTYYHMNKKQVLKCMEEIIKTSKGENIENN